MKLALIFLSAFVVLSHQQMQQLVWWSPYLPQQVIRPINYQPIYYNNLDNADDAFYRQFRPSVPVVYSQVEELNKMQALTGMEIPYNIENNEISDIQSRIKGLAAYRPAYVNQEQIDPRFFFGTATTFRNPFLRTATFTLTSSVNLTSIQSCIVAGDFLNAAAQAVNCRRKRDLLDLSDTSSEDQFSIRPTETQQLVPTALPFSFTQNSSPQMSTEQIIHHDLTSSKDEVALENTPTMSNGENSRDRRFFNYYVVSTTLTSYTFVSTVVRKTVDLGIANGLNCLPAGYVVC